MLKGEKERCFILYYQITYVIQINIDLLEQSLPFFYLLLNIFIWQKLSKYRIVSTIKIVLPFAPNFLLQVQVSQSILNASCSLRSVASKNRLSQSSVFFILAISAG